MPTPSTSAQPAAVQSPWAAPVPTSLGNRQRRLLAWATVGCISLLLGGTGAYLWHDHNRTLQEAGALASQRALRLAEDVQQALALAQTVIQGVDQRLQSNANPAVDASPERPSALQTDLLGSLPLPFALHAIGPAGRDIALVGVASHAATLHTEHPHALRAPANAHWAIGDAQTSGPRHLVPLSWPAGPNTQGITDYGVDLDFEALQKRLERERRNPDDRASLFRLNADGSATVLARSPPMDAPAGLRINPAWVAPAQRQAQGILDLTSDLDGQHRRVAYHRLAAPADNLVVVYGAATNGALASWTTRLPYMVALALLLAAGMAVGGRRLDRSLRALNKSERQFELVLGAGNVWDWDIETNHMRYSPNLFNMIGQPPLPGERMGDTLFRLMLPEDAQRVALTLREHLAQRGAYESWFRVPDAQGKLRWFETQGQAFWNAQGRATYMAGTTFEVTARRELEEAQRQTLQNLDTVANASAVLFWTSDAQGQRDWVNHRWVAFTGTPLEPALGDGWLASVHPDDRERRREATPPVDAQQACVIEYRLRHHDGGYRWVVEQLLPRLDADQRPIGHIGSCVDITELREAEAAARQRGAMLERVFDVLQDMLFVVDAQGRFLHYQGDAKDSLHAPPELFLGRTIDEIMPGAQAALLHRQIALAKTGQLQEFDYSLALPGGDRRFNARAARLPDSDHYMFVVRDLTERETLKQQRERLQRFLMLQLRLASRFINQPLHAIAGEIDRALGEIGAFVKADRAYIFSYDLGTQTACNTHEWCADGIEPAIDQLQNLSMTLIPDWIERHLQQKAFVVEDVQQLPAGNLRDIIEPQGIRSLITLPMKTHEGLLGFVGFDSVGAPHTYDDEEINLLQVFAQMLVNVHERQHAEAQLRALTDQLEQRVAERTGQLDTSVKRLSQANRELGSFAYSVSHDLKSPLRSMEGFASLLLEEHGATLGSEAKHYLERIQSATRHMARLINDLLAYAHIEQLDQGLVPVALASAVNEVLKGMANELEAQAAQVAVDIDADIRLTAYPQGLAMVLRNLIDNALKFTRPGQTPAIHIRAEVNGAVVHVAVADQGQGFDMQHQDRIFAIFQRLHRQDEIPGTGIGLAMVHKAIERMDGRIWAESTPGQGATFHIELPRA